MSDEGNPATVLNLAVAVLHRIYPRIRCILMVELIEAIQGGDMTSEGGFGHRLTLWLVPPHHHGPELHSAQTV